MCERWHQLTQLLARLTAAELGADRQDFSVPWLHTAGAVTGFVLNAGALRRDRKCQLSILSHLPFPGLFLPDTGVDAGVRDIQV